MAKRNIFNVFYFIASLAVFAWMLRDHPHMRLIPILSILACGFYGFLAIFSVLKPNGFAVTHEVLPMRKQRCLRRWALLLPIPALLYFGIYSACLQHAGEYRCLNKFFNPIAKFEKASFSRDRMVRFVTATHPRLIAAAERNERNEKWRAAESYYKAATRLENRLYDKKLPSSDAIMACLYDKMGRHDKAERMYLKAEEVANAQSCSDEEHTTCKHVEIVSVPHIVRELSIAGLDRNSMQQQYYPWLVDCQSTDSANIIGRQFVELNPRSKHSHDWCNLSKCAHKCNDHKDCKNKHKCDDDCKDDKHDEHALPGWTVTFERAAPMTTYRLY